MVSRDRRTPQERLEAVLLGVGSGLGRVRVARRITQRQLSEACGVSQSAVSLIERGRISDVTVASLVAMGDALDVDVDVVLTGPLHSGLDSRRDLVHAACCQAIARLLIAAGWLVREEVPIGTGTALGFIDVLAFHPATGTLLIIEVKSRLLDLGGLLRSLAWYEREAVGVATGLGWTPFRTTTGFVLLASEECVRDATPHHEILARRFPLAEREISRFINDPRETDEPFMTLLDPSPDPGHPILTSSAASDDLPYIDYAHAARVLGT